jgi:hypothetical protein
MSSYHKVGVPASTPHILMQRVLLWVVLILWAAPPTIYLTIYASRSLLLPGAPPPTVSAPMPSTLSTSSTSAPPSAASLVMPSAGDASAATVVSQKSCSLLRTQHGNGSWEAVRGARRVCSELRRLPGGGECPTPKVWIAASKLCIKLGARLCTSSELLAGAGKALGCAGEVGRAEGGKQLTTTMWSSTHCGIGGSNLVQRSNGIPGVELSTPNASRPFAAGIPNCDISSGRHQGACCADDKVNE